MKPKIGITLGAKEIPSDKEYIDAVINAGGEAIPLRPGASFAEPSLDGLLLSGGEDVDPEFYDEKKEPFCDEPDRKRDEFEFKVLNAFLKTKKPVLAICRGIQVLNVAMQGNLHQDLAKQFGKELLSPHQDQSQAVREEKRKMRHPIVIKKNSKLSGILGEEKEVNSRHHQALKDLPTSLEVTAISPDGVIEGVESKEHPWVVGVQWHPESTEVYPAFSELFKAFVSQCVKKTRTSVKTPQKSGT